MENAKIYFGLDIGTDSVGWAVTDPSYHLKRYHGNLMWGVHLFDEASQAADRRIFRTARRRLDRKQQRIQLFQELISPAILEIDPQFFLRIKESALLPEDAKYRNRDLYFPELSFNDASYHKAFPTIHHLICELMNNPTPHDVRLVYIACAYLLAHRGHFLREVSPEKIEQLLDFSDMFEELICWFNDNEISFPFKDDPADLKKAFLKQSGLKGKESAIKECLLDGKFFKTDNLDLSIFIRLLAGGTVKISALFCKDDYQELEKDAVCIANADFDDRVPELSAQLDDGHVDLLRIVKNLYDWSMLMAMLDTETNGSNTTISGAKVKVYETHQQDLRNLKAVCKRYLNIKEYNTIFRDESVASNYVWYSYHFNGKIPEKGKRASQEEFCKFISSYLKNIRPEKKDASLVEQLKEKAEKGTLCPKQVTTDNRVIPYQLYYRELKCILENASNYIPLLRERDTYGTMVDKILSIMKFRIPYYIGPLVSDQKSKFAWMKRKAEGKIYPWNFNDMVDSDTSEAAFIRRMTCSCTYLAGETVLPKNSLLYSKFCVLNEINLLAVDGERISVKAKQELYDALFLKKKRRITKKAIQQFLCSNGYMTESQTLSGIDDIVKSSLKSYHDFHRLLSESVLTEADVEALIERITVTTDKSRLKKWIAQTYPNLSDKDVRYVTNLKYQDYGRLSRKFLEDIYDVNPATGELYSENNIITALWETNESLMQLLSDRHFYREMIESSNREWYSANPQSIEQRMDSLFLPKPVRRSVTRTLDIVKELRSLIKDDPDKIFIEMARGGQPDQKGKRTKSRRMQLEDWFFAMQKDLSAAELETLKSQLASVEDNQLRSDKYFLYFMQLGKCMYSGKPIEFDQIGNSALYNIDHIYPQAKTMDDSIDNQVLVLSELNGQKSDIYPISGDIRKKMHSFWSSLRKNGLISQKSRLAHGS